MYDGRSAAMGGAGQAYIEGMGAAFHNPANLDGIGRFGFTLHAQPTFVRPEGPLYTPNQEEKGERAIAPMILGGVGGHLHDRVAVGGAFFIRGGAGARYKGGALDGDDLEFALYVMEMTVPISIKLTDQLKVGIAPRMIYVIEQGDTQRPLTAASPPAATDPRMSFEMSGLSKLPGLAIGVQYQPLPKLRFGATYRSVIKADLDGDLDVSLGDLKFEAPTGAVWRTPHSVHLGAAYQVHPSVLLVADFDVRLFEKVNKGQTIDVSELEIQPPDGPPRFVLNWQNVYQGRIGVEGWLNDVFALRGGYHVGNSATPASAANALSVPPGMIHVVTAGVGLRVKSAALDLAGSYAIIGADVDQSISGPPGRYTGQAGSVGLAARYDLR